MAGLLDFLGAPSGGGLLDFLRQNALNQPAPGLMQSDQAQYGPSTGLMSPPQFSPASAPLQANAQMSATPSAPQASSPAQAMPFISSNPGGLAAGVSGFFNNLHNGPIGALIGGIGSAAGLEDPTVKQTRLTQNLTAQMLAKAGAPMEQIAAGIQPGNGKLLETLYDSYVKDKAPTSMGEGYVWNPDSRQFQRVYTPSSDTPTSIKEYEYYRKQAASVGQQPMPYDLWSTSKARAGATNISNNIDMNSGVTYDKQLAEGLGKSHAALANGVEDAQTRARDIAAMQGAVDAIQKNDGTTGGMGQQQVLDLKKTINAGAAALGMDHVFNEGDLSDKEFLTKFNRQMAGAQAKNAMGSRVTNFEMSNYLKANPGLDMSLTGNQRLLGIQAQIEDRNVSVGNAIRMATAEAISKGQKIDPVTVQKIITQYDEDHHIKDPITGQDLTKSYALPEFQNSNPTNKSMSDQHEQNIQGMEKKVGGKTYYKGADGNWYVK